MNQVLSTPYRQLSASEEVAYVYHQPHTDEAKESPSLLTRLAYSAYASWLSNGRPSYGV